MTGKTHMAGGLLLSSALITVNENIALIPIEKEYEILFLVTTVIFSLFCDIDKPESLIGRKLIIISFMFYLINKLLSMIAVMLPKKSNAYKIIKSGQKASDHRGITHWLFTAVLLSIIPLIIRQVIIYNGSSYYGDILVVIFTSILTGMLSHIIYDIISGKVPLLAPFYCKKIGVLLVRTDSLLDRVFIRYVSLIMALWLCYMHFFRGVIL